MAIRLSGLTSGMDTDAIVQELVKAYDKKTEKYEKQQTKLTWKQDAWKSLNTKIYSLYTNVSNMRMTGSYNLRKTSISDNTKATVTANSDAVTGTQTLNILKTAQASYITGAKLGDDVTANTKLSDLGYKGGDTSFEVEDKDGEKHEIKVTKSTTVKEVIDQLKEAGLNASFDATNKRIFISAKDSGTKNDFNLVAGGEEGNDVLKALGLNTALLDEKGNFINGAEKYKEAYAIFLKAQENGFDNVVDYINSRLQDYEDNKDKIREFNHLEKQLEARKAHNAIFAGLKKAGLSVKTVTNGDGTTTTTGITSFQLRDMVKSIATDGKFTIEEIDTYMQENGIEGADATEVWKVLDEQKENVKTASTYLKTNNDLTDYSVAELEQQIAEAKSEDGWYTKAVKANEENEFIYLKDENDTAEKLANAIQQIANDADAAANIKANAAEYQKGAAVKITGQDAEIELNGVHYTSETNGFVINGLTINAQAETKDGPITITTNVDTQAIYDKIKDFLTEYNNVINEMTKLYNAESASDYEPLTDEEKEAMSEEQIEKWEDKIKGALLRRDGSLNSIMSTMVNSMSQSFEVDGVKLSLGSFGISTLGFLNSAKDEQYAYHIDGDEDDENTSGKKDKLMKAIEENPDQLMGFMQKLMGSLYENIDKKMKSTELSSAYKVYNDKEMDKEATRIEQMIKKWEDKISDKEEYYYDKFTQMEVALSKLQNQTSSISGLLGGMQ